MAAFAGSLLTGAVLWLELLEELSGKCKFSPQFVKKKEVLPKMVKSRINNLKVCKTSPIPFVAAEYCFGLSGPRLEHQMIKETKESQVEAGPLVFQN